MSRIGVIGAGAMGKGIAANLKKAGHVVIAYKREIDESDEKVIYLRRHDVTLTESLNQIFSTSDILVTCLSDSPTMENIILGSEGLLHCSYRSVKTLIDFTTALPDSTRKISAALRDAEIEMLDAPMTKGPREAEEGTINLVIGGDLEVFEKHRPLLERIAATIVYAGPAGSGNAVKLMNNYLGLLNRSAVSTVALMTQQQQIPLEAMYEFISVSGGNSAGFQAVMKSILSNEYPASFALKLAHKDLRYNLELFDGMDNPLLDTVVTQYREAEEAGFGEEDTNAIYLHLKNQQS